MGIAVVLMIYAVALTIGALVGVLLLRSTAYLLTRKSTGRRKRAMVASTLFPFACVLFAGAWFIAYSTINSFIFHRDPDLGDTWKTPLPNGYALLMIDTTDQGTVYNPRTQSGNGVVTERADAVFGVRQLQIAGDLIFGARDTGYFDRIGQDSKLVDSYFELNTLTNMQMQFTTRDELRKQASSEGVDLQLRDYASVFHKYRTTWFDYSAVTALFVTPAVGSVLLLCWAWRAPQTCAS